jgi:hypothetical protein
MRMYFYAAERHSLLNATIEGMDLTSGAHAWFRREELDAGTAAEADNFTFEPADLGAERIRIDMVSRGASTTEELTVKERGAYLLPAYKAVVKNSLTGAVIFQCQTRDFPDHLPTCGEKSLRY